MYQILHISLLNKAATNMAINYCFKKNIVYHIVNLFH